MISIEDFDYVLDRLKRDRSSPLSEALKLILVHGKFPVEAIKLTGVPMVRLMPPYEESLRVISGMRVTEADGFTADELLVANRALAVSRSKETRYAPTTAELTALSLLRSKPNGSALKAMDGRVDEIPGATFKTLSALHKGDAVAASNEGLMLVRWTITPHGIKLIEEGMKKR